MEASDWISVNDRLPEVDTIVLIHTTNNKCGISSMYIPKDCHGNVLGEKKWHGCGAMKNAITHWQPIVFPKKEKTNEIQTEKLLPQKFQDMLSAHHKYTRQANDINDEIIRKYDNRDKI